MREPKGRALPPDHRDMEGLGEEVTVQLRFEISIGTLV